MFSSLTLRATTLVLTLAFAAPAAIAGPGDTVREDLTVTVPVYKNTTCPIMGRPASNRLFVDVKGGRIYICCLPCVPKIKEKPAKSLAAAYPVVKAVGNTTCPVTGKALLQGHPFVVLQGRKIGVFDAAAKAIAEKHAQVTLVKALRKNVVDVKNTICPISRTAVAPNMIVLVGKNIVHLSSLRVVRKVRQDAKAALTAARASARSAATTR